MSIYEMITLEHAESIFLKCLISKRNDAIETIWHLQRKLHELQQENELLKKSYEEISIQLYGKIQQRDWHMPAPQTSPSRRILENYVHPLKCLLHIYEPVL